MDVRDCCTEGRKTEEIVVLRRVWDELRRVGRDALRKKGRGRNLLRRGGRGDGCSEGRRKGEECTV